MNRVIFLGRIVKDVELRYLPSSGTPVASFTLAVTDEFKKDQTDFINCYCFGKRGEAIAQYIGKGQQVLLEGNWKNETYTAKDGTKKYATKARINKFYFVGNKPTGAVDDTQSDVFGAMEEPIDAGDAPW